MDAAIRLLIRFQKSSKWPCERERGSVQRRNKLRFRVRRRTVADVGAARLVVRVQRAAGNFQPLPYSGRPHFKVVCQRVAEPEIAARESDNAVLQTKQLQDALGMS